MRNRFYTQAHFVSLMRSHKSKTNISSCTLSKIQVVADLSLFLQLWGLFWIHADVKWLKQLLRFIHPFIRGIHFLMKLLILVLGTFQLKRQNIKKMIFQSVTKAALKKKIRVQSTLALRTPRYSGHPDKTDSGKIPGKNKLQTFDWNKLPLIRTLADEDTNLRSIQCPL